MTAKISPHDWEALSAYLDGQLPRKERTRLEEKLKESADLRAALEGLRRTQRILRSQAGMRAPRNFTLTAEMVGTKKPSPASRPLYPVFRLATVLATFLFALVLAGDFLSRGQEPAILQIASRSLSQNQEMLSAPEAPAPLPEMTNQYPAPTPMAEVPLLKGAGGGSLPTATPEGLQMQAGIQSYPPPEAAPAASLRSSEAITSTLTTPDQLAADSSQLTTLAAPSGWPTWRILELAFALLALITGILAIAMRRAGRL